MTDNKTSYLTKLLTLLIKRNGGRIAVPVTDLIAEDEGEGMAVHFDSEKKELILSYVPKGSTIYRIEGNQTWLNPLITVPSSSPIPIQKPVTRDDLIAKAWTEPSSPTNQPTSQGTKARVTRITDESLAEEETRRRQAEVMKELEGYQPQMEKLNQTTPSATRRMETFYKS
jgi:hypothetical protein